MIETAQATTTRLEREIALLREYRTRLIADVVTGKLDVREAAARLSDLDVSEATGESALGPESGQHEDEDDTDNGPDLTELTGTSEDALLEA
ncbi:MAG TPA: hypothetical protein VMV46_18760 [Thermoanaerobaculia bacterium]|nr:hypothetical protein [Thermoanaerobaculia bacterium]